ncbi:MAG: zinc ABC transporter ATP-binding protein [Sulfurimonas sp. RIFOXYD12_FULL_36_11]|jgi:zinc transport system ATP-binding protein|uniref:metal ABC transporter ATP-binding protein n=1 Tax=unclassified Sulfurimonas TaxID=2623549 RepID=UPI0008C2D9E8|nr:MULTISPECIES: metal ABC transporter ATP-binding protein [unclassified Sulfurimonas]OHE11443.1 MAG: zinc ABC transporter ATP-binding protein [Sulfurimonas sp. RIFOXYD12_FULL_36_11]MBS4068727.1 metal ABC transporter ATP-binding protein [Sulfurimonas sp.]MDD3854365.1 metal ABC transporter ATP-binding protein [Sulfurimonas sp.]MDX9755952.1 metal ABC transporter ATP-binding protein [Sulfurimonas sp.]OHE06472.1 MAG: zinc ABC transporter ATP-binding protein [Sulfurimonas sp. RIFOXYB12_FULL_35_9]
MKFNLPIFDIKNLSFIVKGQRILSNISLEIFRSEYIAIIGPNGGGKTTLVRMLLGLEKPTSGEVKIYGKKLSDFKEWHKIGYVPQRASHVDSSFPATVLDIVKMGRTSQGGIFSSFNETDKKLVYDAMAKMDILDLQDKMIGTLSGGQRQRAMIARALASNPEILILDEPNTGVDVASQKNFYALLRKLNQEDKITIVFITHDIGVIADDIARLFTINEKAVICNDPKHLLSCQEMSELYGIDAHLLHNHKHEH